MNKNNNYTMQQYSIPADLDKYIYEIYIMYIQILKIIIRFVIDLADEFKP